MRALGRQYLLTQARSDGAGMDPCYLKHIVGWRERAGWRTCLARNPVFDGGRWIPETQSSFDHSQPKCRSTHRERHATHMHGTGKQKATHLTQGGIVEAPGKGQTVRRYDPAERQKVLLLLLASPRMAM